MVRDLFRARDFATIATDAGDLAGPRSAQVDRSVVAARDSEVIWRAGVSAVDSAHLVSSVVELTAEELRICGEKFNLPSLRRIVVMGAGKASAGMARGLEEALGPELVDAKVCGWVNVPADCLIPLRRIHLHPARPAGLNEPTEVGVAGSAKILELATSLSQDDLGIVLLSGGGSALLPLPVPGISLADKQIMTRTLSRAGATIQELNTVRKRLSRIKGGGLARAPQGGRMIALIISDIVGDPLDLIASGPTVCDAGTAADAFAVLEKISSHGIGRDEIPTAIWDELRRQANQTRHESDPKVACHNFVVGNNQTAIDAAAVVARQLGYQVQSLGSERQGFARDIGFELAEQSLALQASGIPKPVCLIGGGEPVVRLNPTSRPRRGGRNQEVALAALCWLWNENYDGIAILSGGTDGEDGPTDAAGAICCTAVQATAQRMGLDPFEALSINDSYTFFDAAGGLLKTGPTHTNVMDLQVAVVR